MNIDEEKYKVNQNTGFNDLLNILNNYESINLDIDDFNSFNGVYNMALGKEDYALEELFELFYTPWDVQLLVKEGFLEGRLLTNSECMHLIGKYFLNTKEVIRKRKETIYGKREFYSKDTKSRWDDKTGKWDEWKKKALASLKLWKTDPVIARKQKENHLRAVKSKEYKCKIIKASGVREYRESIVRIAGNGEWNGSVLALFSVFLKSFKKQLLNEENDLGFLAPKQTRKKDAKFLEGCVKGNFFYMHYLFRNFDKVPAMKDAARYMKEQNISLDFHPKDYEGYKGLAKEFGVRIQSEGSVRNYSQFNKFYYPYLAVCDVYNKKVHGKKELYNVLMDKSYDVLFAFLCSSPNNDVVKKRFRKFYRRFLRSYNRLKNNNWITGCS